MNRSKFAHAGVVVNLLFVLALLIGPAIAVQARGEVPAPSVAAPAAICPIKVMPLGDSVTYGIGSQAGPGYRFFLNNATTFYGTPVQYVGRFFSPPPNHEGVRGARFRRSPTLSSRRP